MNASIDMSGEIKPLLTALFMPSSSLLLGIMIGLIWSLHRPRFGRGIALSCVFMLWFLATPSVSVWLSRNALQQFEPAKSSSLASQGIQAIVVLGAGLETDLPDGIPQLRRGGLDRLRHAVELSRATGIPIAATGGRGWGSGPEDVKEADVAARVAQQSFGITIRWKELQSRDTRENALNTYQMLSSYGVNRIALVTHNWHMPRALQAFNAAGFSVIPAPMGYITSSGSLLLQYLPSATAMESSTIVIRELVAIALSQSR